ncbi:glutamine amidotransferase [Breznakia sp. PF5-3]|uniref:imidazole glycerol phosphate synthase subunit HisH n=1 Tax=unclassified Breznakia TaxID=2623764 RepID=UPI0024058F15|nr:MULTISPECIES: imidazole glycerol phosphate synthase subunit HisH [unclassified Breznakia]MDF9825641.1 glutamine amidotransferase [Breznakia sp. PM6-1]MDF9836479.1 glutamine amidotransferase [Breznakia sp. PF5-3]
MIAIIDYGMGNLHSVENALIKIGAECKITNQKEEIYKADGIILPGVGAFQDCMNNLNDLSLVEVIKTIVEQGKPLLGICLGMQVLFEKGYEGTECEGLGILKGNIVLMKDQSVKIPHIGWNRLERNKDDFLFDDLKNNVFVYYVHSYYASDYQDDDLVAYSNYGSLKIPGYVHKNNVLGMQYHPEKSGEDGLEMLKKFKEMCK